MSLYPAGHYSRDITFAPSVTLPHGWQFGTALETLSQSGRYDTLQAGDLQHAGRFADVRRPVFRARRPRSRCGGARAPRHVRRCAEGSADDTAAAAGASQPRDAGVQAVRLASLRPLRLPLLALRPADPERARASSVERGRQQRRIISPTGTIPPPAAICSRTSTPTHGTASSAAPPTCGRPTSTCPWATRSCGSTKVRHNTGVSC